MTKITDKVSSIMSRKNERHSTRPFRKQEKVSSQLPIGAAATESRFFCTSNQEMSDEAREMMQDMVSREARRLESIYVMYKYDC